MQRQCHVFVLLLLGALSLLLAGCGGGGVTPAPRGDTGRLAIAITWPERSRLVPVLTESIQLALNHAVAGTLTRTAERPEAGGTSTVTFEDIPVGDVTLTATAYPFANAAGTALAVGQVSGTVYYNQTTTLSVTMQSSIASVSVTPEAGDATVLIGETNALIATAQNAANAMVLVNAASGFHWTSSNPTIASVDDAGLVTGKAEGTVTITAMERESGKSGSLTLTVVQPTGAIAVNINNPAVTVAITPANATVEPNGTASFSATVANAQNTAVVWSVVEAGGGSVTQQGVYTAPETPGTYHVKAVSIANPGKSATATITVESAISAPAYINVFANAPYSFYVEWSGPESGWDGVIGMELQRRRDGEATWTSVFNSTGDINYHATSWIDTTIEPDVTYYYRVRALGEDGKVSGWSSESPPAYYGI